MALRSQLFVPGNRPDRFEKACRTEADLVCIDLEDAVGVAEKESARKEALEWLSTTKHTHVGVRINPVDTEFGQDDIAALIESGLTLPFIMVPKLGSADQIKRLNDVLPDKLGDFFAIIETAKGLVNCHKIFKQPRVKLAIYGAIDYAGDVGCDLSWETHLYARSRLVAYAAAHDVTLFDTPHTDVQNIADCEASTRRAKALGIFARSAIHPAQIAAIHNALQPSKAEITQAKKVLSAFEAANGNVALLDGKMIEEPMVKAAQRILSSV